MQLTQHVSANIGPRLVRQVVGRIFRTLLSFPKTFFSLSVTTLSMNCPNALRILRNIDHSHGLGF
jgi:hypothetical protein